MRSNAPRCVCVYPNSAILGLDAPGVNSTLFATPGLVFSLVRLGEKKTSTLGRQRPSPNLIPRRAGKKTCDVISSSMLGSLALSTTYNRFSAGKPVTSIIPAVSRRDLVVAAS